MGSVMLSDNSITLFSFYSVNGASTIKSIYLRIATLIGVLKHESEKGQSDRLAVGDNEHIPSSINDSS
jgi:hypothetical protein